ncbi:MAG: homoserine dehydrogenase [Candidatus Margulisiibacteriota bacterium]
MSVINIGLIGFGIVGTGVAKILLEQAAQIESRLGKKVVLKKIVDLDITHDRGIKLPAGILSTKADDIINDPEINIVIEVIGGVKPARDFIISSLKNGKHVVTSNKEVIAKCGREIFKTAKENGVNIFYEAAVGGGIPILRPLNKCLAANKIEEVCGIVNGTTNYILSKMTKEGRNFSDILKEAQDAGFAEADPTADVEGFDAMYKVKILTSLAYGVDIELDDIYREGISKVSAVDIEYAKEFGYVIKLLAIAKDTENGLDVRVHPTMIPKDHALASVSGAFNAIFVHGNNVGETMFYGPGAGMLPTASAVVADMLDLAADGSYRIRDIVKPDTKPVNISMIKSQYYLRLIVVDKPGVLGKISTILGNNQVSILTVLQKEVKGALAELIIITDKVQEVQVQSAIKEMTTLDVVHEVANLIRVGL